MNIQEPLTYDKMKTWDLIDFLATMGFQPRLKRGNDYWYCSPLREEKNPSFKIARKHNIWYDHGIGKGGTIIDFIMAYYNCSLKDVFQKAIQNAGFQQPFSRPKSVSAPEPEKKIEIHSIQPIKSLLLERYLHRRNIPADIGKKWCKEVHFALSQKQYIALGFLNQSGGWELRNDWFKGSSSPKDISIIKNGMSELAVFEGFFDFLSHLKMNASSITEKQDFLILNSTSFVERAITIMDQYPTIKLFLDRDNTGLKCTQRFQKALETCTDESILYKGFKDLNEWHTQFGKKSCRQFKSRLK